MRDVRERERRTEVCNKERVKGKGCYVKRERLGGV